MRVMLLHPGPHFSVADVYKGWLGGLQQHKVTVAAVNLDDRLNFYEGAHTRRDGEFVKSFDEPGVLRLLGKTVLADVFQFWPDLVLVVSGFFVLPDVLDCIRSRGIRVAILHTESPYEDTRQLRLAKHADFNLLNDPTNLPQFQEVSEAWYSPHGYDPCLHRPSAPRPELKSDFVFVGTGYPTRVEFFEQVDWDGIDALFAGNWRDLTDNSPLRPLLAHDEGVCCPNETTVELYNATKCSANLYRNDAVDATADGWAMGPREVELAASGTFFLRDPRGESDALLPMLPTFTDPTDFGERLRWWLTHDTEREEAAEQARTAVAARTFKNIAADLLKRL